MACEIGCSIGDYKLPTEEALGLPLGPKLSWLKGVGHCRLEEPAITTLSLTNEVKTRGKAIGGYTMSLKKQRYHSCWSAKDQSASRVQRRGRPAVRRSLMELSALRFGRTWRTKTQFGDVTETLDTRRHAVESCRSISLQISWRISVGFGGRDLCLVRVEAMENYWRIDSLFDGSCGPWQAEDE